ncbi:MAG TPA: asparagine synthase (glutamine-hydrolyzing) [Clostridiaceae bacterium]|nr:asparagine synthase (glutamine-hydrolyzing) [Clostridiaceae bacterium]
MCGIAGWINLFENIYPQKKVVEDMTNILTPRGPDSCGFWSSPHGLLGHRRLIVVDPAGGSQPMVKYRGENTFVIVYNGELYNTSELRDMLQSLGHKFTSSSDTEVLLESYIEWGPECTRHINGIFAFAVWNERERSLFLCRDRFGVKPLFYAQRGNSLIFASELKAMLAHPLIEPDIDSEGLAEIFALGPARTPGHGIYKGVHELKPGHYILYSPSGIYNRCYWSFESEPHTDDLETTIDKLRELVQNSIERQLVADVPVCTFLSGGLDSSAITAIAAMHFKNNKNQQLHTFSIDYIDNERFFRASAFQPNSDAHWIKLMSEKFNTIHHNIKFDTPQLVESLVSAVEARDLPGMADIDSSLWLFCKEIKKNATVALSGECADEIFGGYPWFYKEEMLNADTFPWARSTQERTKVFSKELNELIQPEKYILRRYRETLEEVPRLPGENGLEARRRELFYLNIKWFMCTLLDRKDRMSMAHGLEVRVPYCDHRLAQYVWNIPWNVKTLGGMEKGLLRKALSGILPDEVLYRKKSPYPKTHNPSYEKAVSTWITEILNDSSSPLLPFVNKKAVLELSQSESDYGKPWFGQLMAKPQLFAYLIQIDIWMRKYKVRVV